MGLIFERPARLAIADAVDRGADDMLGAVNELLEDAGLSHISDQEDCALSSRPGAAERPWYCGLLESEVSGTFGERLDR